MSNVLTGGVYHGTDDAVFAVPITELTITPKEQQVLMVERIKEDAKTSARHHDIVTLASELVQEIYDYCVKDIADVKEFQMTVITSNLKRYGDLRTDEEAWKRWKDDHCYTNDTLNHFTRVLVNAIKWKL